MLDDLRLRSGVRWVLHLADRLPVRLRTGRVLAGGVGDGEIKGLDGQIVKVIGELGRRLRLDGMEPQDDQISHVSYPFCTAVPSMVAILVACLHTLVSQKEPAIIFLVLSVSQLCISRQIVSVIGSTYFAGTSAGVTIRKSPASCNFTTISRP